jgi:zinc protease
MAHAVEHLVFKGSADRKPGEIDARMESLGGELTARTTRDATQFSVQVPSAAWRDALVEMGQLTLKAAFREEDWRAERPVIESERAYLASEVARIGVGVLATTVWAEGEPYGFSLLGPAASLERYSADDLRLFWKEHYTPAKMTLVVAGPVKAEEVARAAEELLSAGDPEMPPERTLRRAIPREKPQSRQTVGGLTDAATRTLMLAWPTPPAADAHAQATLLVLAELLAPGPDTGRLGGALVRARGLARSVSVEVQLQRAGGLFLIHGTAPTKRVTNLEAELRQQLRRISEDGFSQDELDLARAAVRARILAEQGSVESLAARLAFYDSIDAPEAADATLQRLRSVTAAELTRTLKVFLRDDTGGAVVVGGQP